MPSAAAVAALAVAGLARCARAKQAALRRERDLTDAVLDTAGALVVVLDRAGAIVRFNRACERATGYTAAEMLGRPLTDLLRADEAAAVGAAFAGLTAGDFPSTHENAWVTRDGRERRIHWENTAMVDAAGRVEHVIGTGIDVTETRLAERRLRMVTESSAQVVFEVALDGTWTHLDEGWTRATGHTVAGSLGRPSEELVHPDDRAAHLARCAALVREGGAIDLELRFVRADGGVRWAAVHVRLLRDAEDRPAGFAGTMRDVTPARRADEALRGAQRALAAAEQRQRLALANLPGTMVTLYDRDLRAVLVEGPQVAAAGLDPAALVGRPLAAALPPGEGERVTPFFEDALAGTPRSFGWTSPRTGLEYDVDVTPLHDEDGAVEGVLAVTRDVTERRRLERRLRHLADHDELSGLPNRRRFGAELEQHAARVDEGGPDGALLLVDVDHFKELNDARGHAAGDAAILAIGQALRGALRTDDVVARLGGDEFGVLLTRCDARGARVAADKAVDAVRAAGHTASVGVALVTGSDLRELLERADAAMYAAKGAGRDVAVVDAGGLVCALG